MRTHLSLLRGGLIVLLVGSAILFLVGSTIERNNRHHETTAATPAEGSSGENGTAHTAEGGKPAEGHVEKSHGEAGAKLLGVNTESLGLSIAAVVLSFLLAAAIWLGRWSRPVLLGVLAFGLVFAAGDARELVHQLDDSNSGLASVAALLIVLHLGVAMVAGLLLRPRPIVRVPVNQPT